MSSQQNEKDYWYVQGEAYDLKSFTSVHPGGKDQLLAVQGRDVTEMVYSMHSLASMDSVKAVMEKYRVNKTKAPDSELFAWKAGGFYDNLSKRVGSYIKSLGPKESHKANNLFWCIYALEVIIQIFMFYSWIAGGSYLAPFVAGMISMSIGFMLFHTAGHCGLSKDAKVNRFWYMLYANYILGFFSAIWDLHHNYAHHSYTNIYRKDPDISNSSTFIRKNKDQKFKPLHRFQFVTAYVVLVVIPNQWLGQILQYTLSCKRGKIFGLPMIHEREREMTSIWNYFLMIFGLGVILAYSHGILFALVSLYIYSSAVGISYWACVFPNHDTDMSEQSNVDDVKGTDWGVHQIRHSSNFKIPEFVSYLIGGMSYQIEHHLFPCVHPRHYPAISKIVQEECKKNDVKYHVHSSWLDALKGNFNHLKEMAMPKDLKDSSLLLAFKLPTF